MSEQVLIQFRADKNLKQEVSEIYESLGMDLPTAFRMFMSMSKMVKGIPFSVTIPEGAVTRTEALAAFERMRADAAEMPLDEINAEIKAARGQKK
jgi:DNA-damage-inducible protein J